jgi:GT2 family glycosyltransferase
MKATVIISTYKRPENLRLIFKALDRQYYKNFEVIVSEDDNSPEIARMVVAEQALHPYPILHLYQQKDNGFHKNQMLNRSVGKASGALLVFLDGDCIPHPGLIAQYVKQAAPYRIMTGRRVMLSESYTKWLYRSSKLRSLSFLSALVSGCRHAEEGIYLPFIGKTRPKPILGCNWAILKSHITVINGFDEDYTHAGFGEDVDIEWRLLQSGCHLYSMKFRSIVYHLSHKAYYMDGDISSSELLWQEKLKSNLIVCSHGLMDLSLQQGLGKDDAHKLPAWSAELP